jgi:hypothetical protein
MSERRSALSMRSAISESLSDSEDWFFAMCLILDRFLAMGIHF